MTPWVAERAQAAPVLSFDVATRSCPDFVQVMPLLTSTPGASYRMDFALTLKGDSSSAPSVTYSKYLRGYDRLDVGGRFFQEAPPLVIDNIDWVALGANPRIEVTTLYGMNTDPVTTVGPTYNVPLPATSHPMLTRGSGTVADPFLVGDPTELSALGCYAGAHTHVRLDDDIDLSGVNQFVPLGGVTRDGTWAGGSNRYLSGSIDGAGHTISDLRVVNPNLVNLGFIGEGRDGLSVNDLHFDNAEVVGRQGVGVVIGRAEAGVALRRITITDSQAQGTRGTGLVAGVLKRAQITGSVLEGTVSAQPPTFTGAVADSAARTEVNDEASRTGGIVGDIDDLILVSDVDVDLAVNAAAASVQTVGGLLGYTDNDIVVRGVEGSVALDITAEQLGTSSQGVSGLFGEYGIEQGTFTDSEVDIQLVVRAPATANAVRFDEIGGVSGEPNKSHYANNKITGSVTVDARLATGDVSMKKIGGFAGEVGPSCPSASMFKNLEVNVDVTVLGSARSGGVTQPVENVGGFAGFMRCGTVLDVSVGGAVTVQGLADRVGGLIGTVTTDGSPNVVYSNVINSVVLRGTGVQTGVGSTNVGTVWGVLEATSNAAVAPFTNVWWDSDRNGVTNTAAGTPARPATSANLGTWSWLEAQGFDMNVWCVAGDVPSIIPLTPDCRSPLRSGVPDAPGQPEAAVSGQSVTITWTAPANSGASPITGFVVTGIPGGATCSTTGSLACTISSPGVGTFVFVVQAQNRSGFGPRSLPSTAVTLARGSELVFTPAEPSPRPEPPSVSDGFVTVTPTRVLDTRPTGVQRGTITKLRLASRAPAGAVAVVLNVTSVDASEGGYVSVYPCGMPVPYVSNVNFGVNSTVANAVMTGLGDDGSVCVYSYSATDVVIDVTGWFTRGFVPAAPERAFDTRTGSTPVQAGSVTRVKLTGVAGLPGTASGVALNVTSDRSQAAGYLTVFDCDTRPPTSSVNYVVGGAVANLVVTDLSRSGEVCVYSSAATDVIVDVFGWFHGVFTPVQPQRLLDTRSTSPIGAGQVTRVQVAGVAGVPATAGAVAANITAVGAQTAGFAVVYPCNATPPRTSNLNVIVGQTVANSTYFGLDAGGGLCLYTSGTSDYLVDLTGWFASDS